MIIKGTAAKADEDSHPLSQFGCGPRTMRAVTIDVLRETEPPVKKRADRG